MVRKGTAAGFSVLEAMLCAAIGMIITVAAVPNMITGISNMRLRSSMTSLAGVLQNCRVLAVKQNRHMTTHFDTNPYGILAFVKLAIDNHLVRDSKRRVTCYFIFRTRKSPLRGDRAVQISRRGGRHTRQHYH